VIIEMKKYQYQKESGGENIGVAYVEKWHGMKASEKRQNNNGEISMWHESNVA